jgi:bifunctional DNase/RNase
VNQLDVVGVRVEMPTNQPIVLLREVSGLRYLPIWIGPMEATAIAYAQQGMVPVRPLTHDLFKDVLTALGHELRQVRITGLREGVYYAELVFGNGVEVSARPSDAIALALRTGSPIFGSDEVLEEAGITLPEEPAEQEDEVEKFASPRADQPEDFGRASSRAGLGLVVGPRAARRVVRWVVDRAPTADLPSRRCRHAM